MVLFDPKSGGKMVSSCIYCICFLILNFTLENVSILQEKTVLRPHEFMVLMFLNEGLLSCQTEKPLLKF